MPPKSWPARLPKGVTAPSASSAPATAPSSAPTSSSRIVECGEKLSATRCMAESSRLTNPSSSVARLAQLVAHPPHVDDVAGQAGAGELAADARRVRFERPRRHVRAVAPHLAQQPLAREHSLRIPGELDEQCPLLCREHDLAAAREHTPGGAVD